MKRITFLQVFFTLALASILVTSCNKNDNEGVELNFEITLPAGWQYQVFDDINALYYAWSPLRTEDDVLLVKDTINEDLFISRNYLPGADLGAFNAAVRANLAKLSSYVELYATDTIINGMDSKKLIHLQTIKLAPKVEGGDSLELDIKPIKYFFYKDDYGYLIDCGALPFTFDYYRNIFEDIVTTFTFKN